MMRRAGSLGIILFALSVLAAGEGSPHEKIMQDMIGAFDSIAASLKTITDEETATAAKPALKKSNDAFVDARNRAAKLPAPEKDEKIRLEKLYKPKIEESLKKMNMEITRVEMVPGGKDALKEIAGVLKKDGK
jgi:hypothetical protein